MQKSVADLKAASSVRITGKVVSSGQNIAVDLTDVAAQGCQGTIGLAAAATSTSKAVTGTADIIEADSTVYMKLSESFFASAGLPASDFSGVSGKYIKLASGSDLASFAQLCNPSTLSTAFSKQDTGFVSAGPTTINGQPALAFKQPKNPSNGTVYVSQTATPQIVRIAGPARGPSTSPTTTPTSRSPRRPPARSSTAANSVCNSGCYIHNGQPSLRLDGRFCVNSA